MPDDLRPTLAPPSDAQAAPPEHVATERAAADDSFPASETPGEAVLLVCRLEGETRVVEAPVGAEISIGRLPESTVVVDSPRVSRRHAIIRRGDEGLVVEDLATANGTVVSGTLLSGGQRSLSGGDVISIGPAEIIVAIASGRAARGDPSPSEADRARAGEDEMPDGILAADPAMTQLLRVAKRLAAAPTTVLVLGETGTGKDVVASRLHAWSPRAKGPFVRLNCASLPETLLESELFGHERGAFTGADRRKVGYFEAAAGGTLLLDEIGELPIGLQPKLLRVLEDRTIHRLGGTDELAVDVRIVCATHRDLEQEVKRGRFRQDLYYRVSTFTLKIPPLRERPTEIVLLAHRFNHEIAQRMHIPPPVLHGDTVEALKRHGWPGNVRELKSAIEHGVVLADDGVFRVQHLPASVRDSGGSAAPAGPMREQLGIIERKQIEEALAAEGGSRTHAARRLGISRRALLYKLTKYGIGR
jgi:DNA-binding NtrC family response regulator